MVMRVANGLFLAAFALSAIAQFNDPDALPWIALYTAAAAMCLAWQLRSTPPAMPILLLVISLAWLGSLLPALGGVSLDDLFASVSMRTREVEEAREIGGLALVALWSAILLHRGRLTASG